MRGGTKAPAPKAKAAPPSRTAAPAPTVEDPRPITYSKRSLLELPISDPRGTSSERARAIGGFRGPSQSLPHRALIESSFGRDLSDVKAHVGSSAGHAATQVGANAFTIGNQVAFREEPSLRLAAHEAAHVVQQRSGLSSGSALERDANAIASRVVAGRSATDLLPSETASVAAPAAIQFEKATSLTEDEIDVYFGAILDHWEEQATTLPTGPQRAEARRVYLLLSFPPDLATYDEADAFLASCLEIAKDETKTVEQLKQEPSVDLDFFVDNGDGFPAWWADRINSELYGTSNESTLETRVRDARKEALVNTASISDEIWSHGLPISKRQAAQLRRSSIPDLALSFENARKYPTEPIGKYAGLVVQWERSFAHLMLVRWFRFQLGIRVDQIRRGDLVIDPDTYRQLLATKFFNVKLQGFERAASSPEDMRKTMSALMLQLPHKFYRDPKGGGFKYDFSNEAVQAFWKEVQEVDERIASTSGKGRIWQSWEWAYSRGYFGEAAIELYEAFKENWPWAVARLVAVFIAQFIPGVNVLVDIALLIEFGWDALTALLDLVDTFKSAYDAQTVEALQSASAKMAGSIVGLGAKIVSWALTAGARWTGKQLKKYRDGKKFLDDYGDTRDNRDALVKAKAMRRRRARLSTRSESASGSHARRRLPMRSAPTRSASATVKRRIGSVSATRPTGSASARRPIASARRERRKNTKSENDKRANRPSRNRGRISFRRITSNILAAYPSMP
jgi:hypothetical protein